MAKSEKELLATLSEMVRQQNILMQEKFSDVQLAITEMRSSITMLHQNHENRLVEIERIVTKIEPEKAFLMLKDHDQWIHDFSLRSKLFLGLFTTLGTFLGVCITIFLNFFTHKR